MKTFSFVKMSGPLFDATLAKQDPGHHLLRKLIGETLAKVTHMKPVNFLASFEKSSFSHFASNR